ncbi:SGT1 domain-containing protein [Nonlabens ponticola]|uniref:DUF4190 domain-containing protein n=1 Tax=Nonlabens ponticola TaxID=2496866 RepID=A0A3S9MW89_9FLAO|nr:hypothetical protein [Nonlabens ponticola]AZQ43404.1 hypothetical protein EJ995_03825 [Nonlabens ponticola]
MNEIKEKLSADPGALVIGIIGIVVILTGCCCSLLAIPILILTSIGWIWAAKSKKAYNQNPGAYTAKSYSNVKTGLIINMICTIIVAVLLFIGLIFEGANLFNVDNFLERLESGEFDSQVDDFEDTDDMYDYESDSASEVDEWKYEGTNDTVIENVESRELDSIQ